MITSYSQPLKSGKKIMTFHQNNLLEETLTEMIGGKLPSQLFTHELVEIEIPDTKSKIIRQNNHRIYVSKVENLEGLFVKEVESTRLIGRFLCDLVKDRFNCMGFFTSDELPRYGISRKDVAQIFSTMDKRKGDGDLLIIYAYDPEFSLRINSFLKDYLDKKVSLDTGEEVEILNTSSQPYNSAIL